MAHLEVVRPQCLPSIAGGLAIVFILAFNVFVVPLLLDRAKHDTITKLRRHFYDADRERGVQPAIKGIEREST